MGQTESMGAFNLADWDDLAAANEWPDILLGNGASCAVSKKFAYKALYDEASLSSHDRDIFELLETTNFEEVLSSLAIARRVCRQLGHDHKEVKQRYQAVQKALIKVVRKVHVDWVTVSSGSTLDQIQQELPKYRAVFSTNYDLLLYWAMMKGGPSTKVADMFWNADLLFDPYDTENWGDKTIVYWLHGGLHLYRDEYGQTGKRVNDGGASLLDQVLSGTPPLYVAEGPSELKRSAIRRSEYLEHALMTFADREEALVVLGNSLSDSDAHLLTAIKRSRKRIAYGIYPTTKVAVRLEEARILKALHGLNVQFFDSTTHPLADPSLRV